MSWGSAPLAIWRAARLQVGAASLQLAFDTGLAPCYLESMPNMKVKLRYADGSRTVGYGTTTDAALEQAQLGERKLGKVPADRESVTVSEGNPHLSGLFVCNDGTGWV